MEVAWPAVVPGARSTPGPSRCCRTTPPGSPPTTIDTRYCAYNAYGARRADQAIARVRLARVRLAPPDPLAADVPGCQRVGVKSRGARWAGQRLAGGADLRSVGSAEILRTPALPVPQHPPPGVHTRSLGTACILRTPARPGPRRAVTDRNRPPSRFAALRVQPGPQRRRAAQRPAAPPERPRALPARTRCPGPG